MPQKIVALIASAGANADAPIAADIAAVATALIAVRLRFYLNIRFFARPQRRSYLVHMDPHLVRQKRPIRRERVIRR